MLGSKEGSLQKMLGMNWWSSTQAHSRCPYALDKWWGQVPCAPFSPNWFYHRVAEHGKRLPTEVTNASSPSAVGAI